MAQMNTKSVQTAAIARRVRKSCAQPIRFRATIAQREKLRERGSKIAQLTVCQVRQVTPNPKVPMHKSIVSKFAAWLGVASFTLILVQSLPAQEDRRRGGGDRGSDRGGGGDRGGRGDFNPQEMQARMLNMLRERLEITDDEEWKVISERVAKVSEMRRSAGGMGGGPGGMMGFRGGPPGGSAGGDRGPGPGRGPSANPEMTALQFAIRDKLPEAEIKSRLERVRESRRDNEAKLAKAQEELRAVLSVRQEAIAVMFGLLP